MLAAWREVEGAEDLAEEIEEQESTDSQHVIFAAVESAAAGLGRWSRERPRRLEAQRRRQIIDAQCHCYLRGASLDDYAAPAE